MRFRCGSPRTNAIHPFINPAPLPANPRQRLCELGDGSITIVNELMPAQPKHVNPGGSERAVSHSVAHEGALRSVELVSIDLDYEARVTPIEIHFVAADSDICLGFR